jgi:predicted PurR-regulated permease PerM
MGRAFRPPGVKFHMRAVRPAASEPLGTFAAKAAIVLGMGSAALAAWTLREVIIIFLGALVLAIGMIAMARLLGRKFRIGYAFGLLLVVVTGLVAIGLVGLFFGATISEQLGELVERVPTGLQWITSQIEARPYARDLLLKLDIAVLSGPTGWAANELAAILKFTIGASGSLAVMAIVAIYLAAQPEWYRSGTLRLLPPAARPKALRLFDATSQILGLWFAGQLAAMATVGILSGLGLWAIGVNAAFALGLVGGLMSFVPYIGSMLTAILATLFALAQGPGYAIAVIVMYIGVQFIEGYLITPLIQAEATSLPPAISMLSVIGCGLLFGPSAVFLAVPLTLCVIMAIEVLYAGPMTELEKGGE